MNGNATADAPQAKVLYNDSFGVDDAIKSHNKEVLGMRRRK